MTIILIYVCSDHTIPLSFIKQFLRALQDAFYLVYPSDKIVMLGDSNAWVGKWVCSKNFWESKHWNAMAWIKGRRLE